MVVLWTHPLPVHAGEGSTVGHTGCSHEHVPCHVAHLSIQFL